MDSQNSNTAAKPFISIILPCFNEEAILSKNLDTIIHFLEVKKEKYQWEIVIVNDGSRDKTGEIADEYASGRENIRVIHHPINMNLGRALQTGFRHSKGEIMVVLDVDLSYSEKYIETMVDELIETCSDMVIASPYMKGGQVTGVPFMRKTMSRWVNRIMRVSAQDKFYTFTSIVRAYRSSFVRTLNLKTRDYEISPEIMYKAMILRANIVEIPAHLDWTEQNKYKGKRTSSIRVLRGFFSGIMSAFIFRPYVFFLAVGIFLMALSLFELVWLLYDTIHHLNSLPPGVVQPFSESLHLQFQKNPQTFIVGGITFIAAIQFLSLGFLSLQSKRYFEELFHLGTSLKNQK